MNGTISIARAGQELGAWDAADIEKMLQVGVLTPADHYWQEGMTEWTTLECFVLPQAVTMIFPVTFGRAWSVDKLGFVGKGELHLTADTIELVGRRHWSRLARFGVFVIAAPLGWFLFGSITGTLRADTDAARFWGFCATLFTVLGVPLLVLTLMHYFCVSRAKMHWPQRSIRNVQRSGRVLTFDVPVAGAAKPRKTMIQAVDAATADVILHDLLGGGTAVVSVASTADALAGTGVPVPIDPRRPAQGTVGQRSRRYLAKTCLFVAIFSGLMTLSGTLEYARMAQKYSRFSASYHSPGGVPEGLMHEFLTDPDATSLGPVSDLATLEKSLREQTDGALILTMLFGLITVGAIIGFRVAGKNSSQASPAGGVSSTKSAVAAGNGRAAPMSSGASAIHLVDGQWHGLGHSKEGGMISPQGHQEHVQEIEAAGTRLQRTDSAENPARPLRPRFLVKNRMLVAIGLGLVWLAFTGWWIIGWSKSRLAQAQQQPGDGAPTTLAHLPEGVEPGPFQRKPSRADYEQRLAQTQAVLGQDGTIVIEDSNGATLSLTIDDQKDANGRPSMPFRYEIRFHYDNVAILPNDDPRNSTLSEADEGMQFTPTVSLTFKDAPDATLSQAINNLVNWSVADAQPGAEPRDDIAGSDGSDAYFVRCEPAQGFFYLMLRKHNSFRSLQGMQSASALGYVIPVTSYERAHLWRYLIDHYGEVRQLAENSLSAQRVAAARPDHP